MCVHLQSAPSTLYSWLSSHLAEKTKTLEYKNVEVAQLPPIQLYFYIYFFDWIFWGVTAAYALNFSNDKMSHRNCCKQCQAWWVECKLFFWVDEQSSRWPGVFVVTWRLTRLTILYLGASRRTEKHFGGPRHGSGSFLNDTKRPSLKYSICSTAMTSSAALQSEEKGLGYFSLPFFRINQTYTILVQP